MSDEKKKESAYQEETPWQMIGKIKGEGYSSVEEALEAGDLNWEVELQNLYYPASGCSVHDKPLEVPNRKAVVQAGTDEYLGTVGGVYQPLQNRDAFGVLETACAEFGVKITGAGHFSGGRRVWMQARLPANIEVADGDFVDGYFLIVSGHDGGAPYTARGTPMRVLCLNSLMAALRGTPALIVLRHTSNQAERLSQVHSMVNDLLVTLQITGKSFTQLAHKRLTPVTLEAYVNAVLNIESSDTVSPMLQRRRARVVDLVTLGRGNDRAPNTLWAAYNAFTEYTDHVRPAEVSGAQRRRANESALFGANAALKQRAFDIALKIAA